MALFLRFLDLSLVLFERFRSQEREDRHQRRLCSYHGSLILLALKEASISFGNFLKPTWIEIVWVLIDFSTLLVIDFLCVSILTTFSPLVFFSFVGSFSSFRPLHFERRVCLIFYLYVVMYFVLASSYT